MRNNEKQAVTGMVKVLVRKDAIQLPFKYNKMRRADNRTDYVLGKAHNNSEWDKISFAVFHRTDKWLQALQTRLDRLQPFRDDLDFWEHIYFGSPEGFFTSPEARNMEEILEGSEPWAFVETSGEELESLPLPEHQLDTHLMEIGRAHV